MAQKMETIKTKTKLNTTDGWTTSGTVDSLSYQKCHISQASISQRFQNFLDFPVYPSFTCLNSRIGSIVMISISKLLISPILALGLALCAHVQNRTKMVRLVVPLVACLGVSAGRGTQWITTVPRSPIRTAPVACPARQYVSVICWTALWRRMRRV